MTLCRPGFFLRWHAIWAKSLSTVRGTRQRLVEVSRPWSAASATRPVWFIFHLSFSSLSGEPEGDWDPVQELYVYTVSWRIAVFFARSRWRGKKSVTLAVPLQDRRGPNVQSNQCRPLSAWPTDGRNTRQVEGGRVDRRLLVSRLLVSQYLPLFGPRSFGPPASRLAGRQAYCALATPVLLQAPTH